ncbi:MAG: biotin/lipoate A/B protein ligase family protein [Euryarchaeota archaeon]|nr:biotin/lipoate A/B protein ligase family protein [Euryarchaeota archaeon]
MNLRYISVLEGDGAYQMAVDEAIMHSVSKGKGENTFRLYRFKPSCISIGYFQSADQEVDLGRCREHGIECVRRITGGGAVFHDYMGEITYSIVLKEENFRYGVEESYEKICSCLVKALEYFGLKGRFSPINDVLAEGKKISGSAQTRKKGVILQHGTFMYATDLAVLFSVLKISNEKIRDKMLENAEQRVITLKKALNRKASEKEVIKALEAGFASQFDLEKGVINEYEKTLLPELQKKYASEEWLFRR